MVFFFFWKYCRRFLRKFLVEFQLEFHQQIPVEYRYSMTSKAKLTHPFLYRREKRSYTRSALCSCLSCSWCWCVICFCWLPAMVGTKRLSSIWPYRFWCVSFHFDCSLSSYIRMIQFLSPPPQTVIVPYVVLSMMALIRLFDVDPIEKTEDNFVRFDRNGPEEVDRVTIGGWDWATAAA